VLSYIATELHPSLAFQFPGYIYKNITAETLSFFRELSLKKFDYLENHLIGDKQFVVGDSFTVADAYLYVILTWTFPIGIDLSPYPKVKAYFGRIGALENVLGAYARIATKPTTSI
jgi:glutathione S-transferase